MISVIRNTLSVMLIAFLLVSDALAGIHFSVPQDPTKDIEDLKIKVLGGYVRITRHWDVNNQGWVWNSRWANIERWSLLTLNRNNAAYIYTHTANGRMVFQDRSGSTILKAPWAPALNDDSINPNEVIWKGRDGNQIKFGQLSDGNTSPDISYIESYQNKNNVVVSFDKNSDQQISVIKDHHGNAVAHYYWEKSGSGKSRLMKVSDYSGREIKYSYSSLGLLESVTDVMGQAWGYEYNSQQDLVAQKNPNGTKTYFNYTAKSERYKVELDPLTNLTKETKITPSGMIVEVWRNKQGYVVKRMESGELDYTAEYIYTKADNTAGNKDFYYRDLKNINISYGDSAEGKEYCKLIGAEPVMAGSGGIWTGCTYSRAASLESTGAHCSDLNCHASATYLAAVEADRVNPLTPKLPSPKSLAPYLKTKIVTDSKGSKTVYEYDQWSNELKVIKPDGTSVVRTWHKDFNLPLSETNESGVTTAYEYDQNGNLLSLVEAKGTLDERVTRYTYDQYGQVKSKTTGESIAANTALATTLYEYDQYGNLIKITNPEGDTVRYGGYDVLGNAHFIVDGKANALPEVSQYQWKQSYDKAGNLLHSLDPYEKGESYAYYVTGALKKIVSPSGYERTVSSNVKGQPTNLVDSGGNAIKWEYDKGGQLIAVIDENGNKSQLSYNDRNQLVKTIDAEGNASSLNYVSGELKSVQYPSSQFFYEYDSGGYVKQINRQANDRLYPKKIRRDAVGNSTSVSDAQEKTTAYEYDFLNRVKKTINAEGGVTEFTYDARDNLLQVKDPEGRLTIYTYDKNDRLLTETKDGDQNSNKQRRYGYDQNGNLVSSINPEEEKTTYEFDKANRLVKTRVFANKDHAHPIKVINYPFNEKNQLTGWNQQASETFPEGVTPTVDVISLSEAYTYNNLEQLESVTVNFGGFTKTYSYTYYPNGLKKTYTNPEGITYTYYYNKNNQLMAVHIPGEGQISWANFDWMVPQTLLLPGGQKILLKYDDFQDMQERVLRKADNTELAKAVYEYDLAKNIKKIEKSEGAFNYNYDDLYRLTAADSPDGYAANDETFDYDGVGNRVSHTENGASESQNYNQKNQLQAIDSNDDTQDVTYTYNANGHTKTETKNGVVTEYVYNHEERLIAVKRDDNTIADYAYNPHGQRIKKTANGSTTWYFYNENGLAAEYSSAGQLIKEYHFHPQKTWMTDPLFQRTVAGELYYYHNDHLGTPQQLLDEAGNIVWAAQYSVFGKAQTTINTVENNLRFPGQYFDVETGLHQNYFRDYDPAIGRYLQEDPIGLNGGLGAYIYAYQSPLSNIDPNGQIVINVVGAAVAAACEAMDPESTPCTIAAAAIGGAFGMLGGAVVAAAAEAVCDPNQDCLAAAAANAATESAADTAASDASEWVAENATGKVGGSPPRIKPNTVVGTAVGSVVGCLSPFEEEGPF